MATYQDIQKMAKAISDFASGYNLEALNVWKDSSVCDTFVKNYATYRNEMGNRSCGIPYDNATSAYDAIKDELTSIFTLQDFLTNYFTPLENILISDWGQVSDDYGVWWAETFYSTCDSGTQQSKASNAQLNSDSKNCMGHDNELNFDDFEKYFATMHSPLGNCVSLYDDDTTDCELNLCSTIYALPQFAPWTPDNKWRKAFINVSTLLQPGSNTKTV